MNVQIAIPPTGQIKRMIAKIEATKEKRERKADLRQYAREFVEMIQTNAKDSKNPQIKGMNDADKLNYFFDMTSLMKRETLMLVSRYLGIHRGGTTHRNVLEVMVDKKIMACIQAHRNGWLD